MPEEYVRVDQLEMCDLVEELEAIAITFARSDALWGEYRAVGELCARAALLICEIDSRSSDDDWSPPSRRG